MRGRQEHKIKLENKMQEKMVGAPEYLQRFYLSIRSKTHATKNVYMNSVIRFLKYIDEDYPDCDKLKEIDSYAIQVYMSQIAYYESNGEVKELKETSQCTIQSALSCFFTFLVRERIITMSPFDQKQIERPRTKENEIVFLTPEEVVKFEKQILGGVGSGRSKARQERWKYRDVLLFRIPVVNGLRVTALSEIDVDDIDLTTRRIKVTEKGNITRTVSIDTKTVSYLQIWLRDRKELLNGDTTTKALFISNRRERMSIGSIENIIKKYSSCIEGKHITPHKLRSTCATNSYRSTKDIYLVAKMLGHKTTAPTRRYAAILKEDVYNAVDQVADLYK